MYLSPQQTFAKTYCVRDYWRPCRFISGQNKVPALVELEKRM